MRARTGNPVGFDYQTKRDNSAWPDHVARTYVTAGLIAWLRPESVLDPACGDGSIVLAADHISPISKMTLCDISGPNIDRLFERVRPGLSVREADVHESLLHDGKVELVVLTEILEHLPDPDMVLRLAHDKGTLLIASSPVMRSSQKDDNPEHLWQFDEEGYRAMLVDAGWRPAQKTILAFPELTYDFQIWACR